MTPQEFADLIDGREYPFDFNGREEIDAEQHGLVVVYGASDDLMELRGAIDDEGDCYDGGTFLIDKRLFDESFADELVAEFGRLKEFYLYLSRLV